MREILFRGKSANEIGWITGSLRITTIQPADDEPYKRYEIEDTTLGVFPNDFMSGICETVIPKTVGQFTGMTDKNNRRIFEHDLIKQHFGDEIGIIRFGKYNNPFGDDGFGGHVGFYVEWVAGTYPQTLRKDLGYWMQMVEVIGNIHDNPELLEVDND